MQPSAGFSAGAVFSEGAATAAAAEAGAQAEAGETTPVFLFLRLVMTLKGSFPLVHVTEHSHSIGYLSLGCSRSVAC